MRINTIFRKIKHLRNCLHRYPAGKRVPVLRDYIHLHRKRGITLEEYDQFSMYNRSEAFRQQFLGINEQRYYLDYLNPNKYYILSRNKYVAHTLMQNAGIRTSELYAYYQPEGSVESENVSHSTSGICRILREKGVQKCVIKTTESSHGDNVLVVNSIEHLEEDAMLHLFNGNVTRLSELLADEPLIFESIVVQTDQMASLNASSVNTVRFMTMLYPDGDARIIATFIKIGRAGKCVDNAGGGGNVDACIDTETGTLQYAIQYDGWQNIRDIDVHPDSGNPINGVQIHDWQDIKKEVLKFQQALPFIKAAGWDIAITNDGPVVIEVNDFWDRTGQYFIRKGWRPEIRDCYFAWKKTGKTYDFGRLSHTLSPKQLQKIIHNE
jgi:hypothetical protein